MGNPNDHNGSPDDNIQSDGEIDKFEISIAGNNEWKIMYANVRGLRGKVNGLIQTLHEHNPHIFLFTETQLKSNFGTVIKGYTFYGKSRTSGSGGGVAIGMTLSSMLPHTSPTETLN